MKLRWNVLGLAALLGCQHPATQLVLRVDSDMREGDELRAVQVTMRRIGASAAAFDQTYDLTAGAQHLPGTLGVVPGDPDDARQLEVEVRAVLRDAEGFSTRAIVSFQPEQTLLLDLFLASRCRDPANRAGCGPDETCGPIGCEPVARATLPGFTVTPQRRDGGSDVAASVDAEESDAPTVVDAGQLDVPALVDAGEPDAPAVTDRGPTDVGGPMDVGCGAGATCCSTVGAACGAGEVCALSGGVTRCTACGATDQPCCAGGGCAAVPNACARPTCEATGRCGTAPVADGTSCGAITYGAWGACVYSSLCDRYGTQTRTVATPTCAGGACRVVMTTGSLACSRATDGLTCASTGYGGWGACGGYTSTGRSS